MTSRTRMFAALLLAVAVNLGHPATAAAQKASDAPTAKEIVRTLEVDKVPADYVVLIDTSGSMATGGLYGEVRATLKAFLRGLSKVDHVAIYTFDDVTSTVYVGPATSPSTMMAKLPSTPVPDANTDIGLAIERAFDELERENAADVGAVVLLTDGKHDPSGNSGYPRTSGQGWKALRTRGAALHKKRTSLFGYPLPLGERATGAKLLGKVMRSTAEIDPFAIPELGKYLDRAKRATRDAKVRAVLANDIGRGVTVAWPDMSSPVDLTSGRDDIAVTLRSKMRHVPLVVDDLKVRVDGPPDVTITGPERVKLDPGETVRRTLSLTWAPGDGPLGILRTRHTTPTVALAGRVSSPWQPALQDRVDLGVPTALGGGTRDVPVAATVGRPETLPIGSAVVLALLLLIVVAWYRYTHPELAGILTARDPLKGRVYDRFTLAGRSTRFDSDRFNGDGSVCTYRRWRHGTKIVVDYSPDGSPARRSTATCGLNGWVQIAGVRFIHSDTPQQQLDTPRPPTDEHDIFIDIDLTDTRSEQRPSR